MGKRRNRMRRRRISAPAVYQPLPQPQKVSAVDSTDVSDLLEKCGYSLKTGMLADCLERLGDSIDGFKEYHIKKKALFCMQILLYSDLNSCGGGILPSDVKLRKTVPGPYVLQVNEIICCQLAPPGNTQRCLKLSMTDGIQTVYGIEVKPIKALQVHAPPGLKIVISNVKLICGCLLLLPDNTRVLGGGLVKQQDEARMPLVDELNNPYRGIIRNGVLPLATRSARPSSGVDGPSHSGSTLHSTDTVQASNQGKSDDLITEGCNGTSGLVVCFGEMFNFMPLVGEVSLVKGSGSTFKKAPGGAPANVAVGISKLGGSSSFISKVGEDGFGDRLTDILKQNNVDTTGMRVDSNARTAVAYVTLKADGEEFLFFQNPSADTYLDKSDLDRKLIEEAKIFHYGSISLIDEPCKSALLAALSIAEESDCILSYDPNLRLKRWPTANDARDGIMSIWGKAHVIKISQDELTFLNVGVDDDVELEKLFLSNLKLLIVTEGSEGCRYYTKNFKGKVRGVSVEAVDKTGAGDAFVSGILYNIASDPSIFENEERLKKALYFANVCGAITVKERGVISALPTKDAVLQFDAYRNIGSYKM